MAYLLHITESLINGQPFIYWMEEFWKPLMDPYFADFALNKQKTIRKQSGPGVFITQSPSDVLAHPIGKTMVEQSVTIADPTLALRMARCSLTLRRNQVPNLRRLWPAMKGVHARLDRAVVSRKALVLALMV